MVHWLEEKPAKEKEKLERVARVRSVTDEAPTSWWSLFRVYSMLYISLLICCLKVLFSVFCCGFFLNFLLTLRGLGSGFDIFSVSFSLEFNVFGGEGSGKGFNVFLGKHFFCVFWVQHFCLRFSG